MYNSSNIRPTSDVVFIIEAGPCNRELIRSKNLYNLVNVLQQRLVNASLLENRYAVIAYGGSAPFDRARPIVHGNRIFTEANMLSKHFSHIRTEGSGNRSDASEGIVAAMKLTFRPAASKTFILIPCSACNGRYMKVMCKRKNLRKKIIILKS